LLKLHKEGRFSDAATEVERDMDKGIDNLKLNQLLPKEYKIRKFCVHLSRERRNTFFYPSTQAESVNQS